MKKLWLSLFLCLCWSFIAAAEPKCYSELANRFFNDDKAILQALSLHRVFQSSWTPIVHALQKQTHTYSLVRQRARQLDKNPLEPYDPVGAEKLLADTLTEVLRGVMSTYQVSNATDISEMFDYIRRHQPLWAQCFPQQATEGQRT